MDADLEKLIQLQGVEDQLRRAETALEDLPRERARLEAALAGERDLLAAARQGLDGCQQRRRKHEGELQDLETKRARYKGQLMEVKTNKEYTTMLHEIEGVERLVSKTEDLVLEALEQAEGLGADAKRQEAVFREAESQHKQELAALEGRTREFESQAAKLRGERDAIAATLPVATRELFQRVARLRVAGVGPARDGMCQLCHVVLRPQMFLEIKRNDSIQQCPSCSRILYYEPPPEEPPVPQS